MKTPIEIKTSSMKRNQKVILSTLAIGLAIVLGLVWMVFNYFGNYAEKTAKPLEAALVKAGATKKCDKGDPGRGPDNTQPWYESYFEIDKSDSQAIELAKSVATENGYRLVHATPANKGPVGADDRFVDKWYFDNTSKQSPYKDLESGAIDLEIPVNADGIATACSGSIRIDSTHSGIGIRVSLPTFKR